MKQTFILLFSAMLVFQSCMKDTFDNPATITDPNIKVTTDIISLKNKYSASGQTVMTITTDDVISGIVTANDKTNNFYKVLVIQDSMGAIGIKIDQASLYNDYPVGRRVFVKLKGMALGNYNNLIQLGGYLDTVSTAGVSALGSVTSTNLPKVIIKGSTGHDITPLEISLTQLTNAHQYMLVKLKNVEFDCPDILTTFADAVNQADASRNFYDAANTKSIIRTSGYANFAGTALPQGNGDMIAIYTVYRTDKQFVIRDVSELTMTGSRIKTCTSGGGSTGGGGTTTTFTPKTIAQLRAMMSGSGVKVTGYSIEGIVISDKDNGNISSKTLIVQEEGGSGIAVYLNSNNTFALGDKVKINIDNDSLVSFKGLLELKNVDLANVSKTGTGTITPAIKTVAEINNNYNSLESTLVKIVGASVQSATYGTSNLKLNDATSNIVLYTATTASFATSPTFTGSKSVTGIVGIYVTTKQLQMRNLNDIQ